MDMYGKAQAKEILKYCKLGEYLTIDDRGVWPGVDRDDMLKVETELLRWKPARVFRNDPNPPDVANTPSLPFPFSAKKLAAFMLSGTGALVVGFYGVWQDGPDPDSLAEIDIDDNLAQAALVGAYAAYREAEKRVGALDDNFEKRADAARRRYEDARSAALKREKVAQMPRLEAGDSNESKAKRDKRNAERDEEYKLGRARALEPLKALHEEKRRSATEAETAYQNWLSAMVRQLLEPDDTQAGQGAPVVETKQQRQDRRLTACEDAGLVMPKSSAGRLPDGVGDVADSEGKTRQAFSTDVKAALKRREAATHEGGTVHRA